MNDLRLPASHLFDVLGRLDYFKEWRPAQLMQIAALAQQRVLKKGERLSAKGEVLDALYVVISGQMRLFIPLPGNTERVVGLAGQGVSVGEACVILAQPCPYEIVAGKNSHLLRIDAMSFRRELRDDHSLCERTLHKVANRLLEVLRDSEICAQRTSAQKVAAYLLQFRPKSGEEVYELHLPARKRDIAGQLGLSHETFSRVLAIMVRQGLIHMKGNQIRIDSASGLTTLTPSDRDPESSEKLI